MAKFATVTCRNLPNQLFIGRPNEYRHAKTCATTRIPIKKNQVKKK